MSTNKPIKPGCHVRFLNAVGGGRVAKVTGDTAWVEDPDGFEIPTLLRECVVVDEGDTFMPAYKPPTLGKTPTDTPSAPKTQAIPHPEKSVPKPHTFLPATGEVSAYLAYLPVDDRHLGQTNYEAYLINDCSYTLFYTYSSYNIKGWKLRAHGMIEPDTKLFIEEFGATEINELDHLNIQLIALAENPGIYKGTYGIELKLQGRKFFKLHTFQDNDFFEDRAWIEPLVEQGTICSPVVLPKSLNQHEIVPPSASQRPKVSTAHKPNKAQTAHGDEPLVIDLHIDELLDDTTGMNNAEILRYQVDKFNEIMQANLKHRGRKIIFIHGKGEGVLRNKIEGELRYRYKQCRYQDASFKEYSYGATQVTIGELPK